MDDALKREFLEEVGTEITIHKHIGNTDYSSEWKNDGVSTNTHHIGLYYEVSLLSHSIKTNGDGHDSDGALWVNISEITAENVYPIAYKILEKYCKKNLPC